MMPGILEAKARFNKTNKAREDIDGTVCGKWKSQAACEDVGLHG